MELDQCLNPFGEEADRTFLLAYVNASLETGIRSPLDAAILAHRQLDIQSFRKVDEIPFDFDRRRLSVVVDTPDGRLLITKGAPEPLLQCCTDYEVNGNRVPSTGRPSPALQPPTKRSAPRATGSSRWPTG